MSDQKIVRLHVHQICLPKYNRHCLVIEHDCLFVCLFSSAHASGYQPTRRRMPLDLTRTGHLVTRKVPDYFAITTTTHEIPLHSCGLVSMSSAIWLPTGAESGNVSPLFPTVLGVNVFCLHAVMLAGHQLG